MSPPWVATHADLALSGLTAAACRPDARAIESVTLASSGAVFELAGHGFTGGEPVRWLALRGNALPGNLFGGRTWYIVDVDSPSDPDFFTVRAPGGSTSLLLSDRGTGRLEFAEGTGFAVLENVLPKIDVIMARWTSMLIGSAKAYKAPWSVPPTWGALMVAMLAAPTVANYLRVPSGRYPIDLVMSNFAWAEAIRQRLENGEPYADGSGPIDALAPNGTYDAAVGTNAVTQNLERNMQWVTGTLG